MAMDSLRISRLTERQRLCLRLVYAHMSSKEIASRLGIEPGTVDQHIKAAMMILSVGNRREAARMLARHEFATQGAPVGALGETAPGADLPSIIGKDEILASIRHGFDNVLNFSGRDTREQFWPYAMFLLIVGGSIAYFIIEPQFFAAVGRMQHLAAEHPAQAGNIVRNHPELMPDFAGLPFVLGLVTLVHLVLMAAAVVRRLRGPQWAALWGYLPLPIANIAMTLQPVILVLVANALMIFAFLYALIRGGAPERIGVTIVVVGTLLTSFAVSGEFLQVTGANVRILVIDCAGLLAFLLLALRSNRFWPIWVVATYILGVAAHFIMLVNPMVLPAAYGAMGAIGAPPLFLLLVAGTRNHRLRLARNGVDPAWTPFPGRSRRSTKSPAQGHEAAIRSSWIRP